VERFKGVMKEKIAKFIPSAFNRALCSYRTFSSKNIDIGEIKDFSAYHSACKNALSHIDNLIKLSDFGYEGEIVETEDNSLKQILENAKKQLKEINESL
jgi:CRISPR/Cas system CMR-associated protein Cmr5 small subunit